MPALKRLKKAQEQTETRRYASKSSVVLDRLLDEIATPLEESAGLCQRLLDDMGGKLTGEQRRSVEMLSGRSLRSAHRLRDYVDLLLIEAGELVLRPEPHDLGEAIEQVARELRPAARAKGINLVVEKGVQPPPPVLADPARVSQVLANLVGNAIKFTDRGHVILSTEPYDRSVAVHIVDTGVGLAPGQLSRLYDDFFQDEEARIRDPESRGLGMTLSRRLVVRIGGDLWASSTVGAGSKFSFTVPRLPAAAPPSRLSTV